MADIKYLYDKDGNTVAVECDGQTCEVQDASLPGQQLGIVRDLNTSIRSTHEQMLDSAATGSIVVSIEATHGGYVNRNHWMYTAKGMKKNVGTWLAPFGKPYLVNHDKYGNPLGRVVDAKFVATGKTTGYHDLTVRIGDKEEIERILDSRSLTVSVGSRPIDSVECSICSRDLFREGNTPKTFKLSKAPSSSWLEQKAPGIWGEFGMTNSDLWDWNHETKTCTCRHQRGVDAPRGGSETEKLYWINHGQSYTEVSRVNIPADINAATGEFAHIKEVLEQNDSLEPEVRENAIIEALSRIPGSTALDRRRFTIASEKDLYYADSQAEAVALAKSGNYSNLFDAGLWLSIQNLNSGLTIDEHAALYHQAGGKFIYPISTASAQDAMKYNPKLFSRWLRAQDDLNTSDKDLLDRLYTRAFIRKRRKN